MSKSGYRDLEVWQKARALATHIYETTADFPKHEIFGLTQQLRRAAVSVPSNIAECHGRKTTRDRVQFLVVARGSLLEIETQALIAADLHFIEPSAADMVVERVREVTRLLNGLIRYYSRTG